MGSWSLSVAGRRLVGGGSVGAECQAGVGQQPLEFGVVGAPGGDQWGGGAARRAAAGGEFGEGGGDDAGGELGEEGGDRVAVGG